MADVSMDTVHIEIESTMKDSTSSIDTLITKLNNLKTSISNVVKESQKLTQFRNNIKSSSTIPNIKTSGVATTRRTSTPKAPFAEYGSLQSQLKALKIDLDTSTAVSSMKTLNSEITKYKTNTGQIVTVNKKVKDGVEGVKVKVDELNNKLKDNNSLWNSLTKGLSGIFTKIGIVYTGFRQIVRKLGDFVDQAATYEEALNLFTVTMGEYAKEGMAWVEKFSNALYLDPTNVMQYMGAFNSLIKGLGVGSEKAYIMSQNLTQLVYDLASFKNLSFEESFRKIQSAISGELEPLRNVGVALNQNTLQELANELGIKKRVSEMTEAEKAQLRYIQILKSTGEWQTDMGRTLLTPANSLRILREQFTLLAKAVGQIFIPILMAALPYVMVLTQALTELAKRIANFLGYEIADVDYDRNFDSITDSIGGVGDAADETTKKLNTMLAPFDELNVVQNKTKSAGNGISGIGGDLGVDLPIYDALANLTKELEEKMGKAKEQLEKILPIIAAVGTALLSWKISSSIIDFMDKFKTFDFTKLSKIAGLTMIIGSVIWDFKSLGTLYDPNSTDDEFGQALLGELGSTVGVAAGTYLLTKSVKLTLLVTAIKVAFDVKYGINELMDLNPTMNELFEGINYALENFPIIGFMMRITEQINDGLADIILNIIGAIGKVREIIKDFGYDVGVFVRDIANNIKSIPIKIGYEVGSWFNDVNNFAYELGIELRQKFDEMKTTVSNKIEETKTNIVNKFEEAKTKANSKVDEIKTKIKSIPSEIQKGLSSIPNIFSKEFNKAKNKVVEAWDGIKKKFSDGGKIFDGIKEGIAETFKNIVNQLMKGINKVIAKPFKSLNNTLNDIRSVNILGVEPFKGLWGKNPIPVPQIPTFATGGYPDSGDLFFANENGIPEMVGRIGNQTAVANNDQIETSLTNALLYALDKSGSGRNNPSRIVVNIGNRKVYEGVGEHIDNENDRYGTDYVTV